jgi:ribosomal protection tetracycline resistance protein
MRALEPAGTTVCEPMTRVSLEVPAATIGAVLSALARLGSAVETQAPPGDRSGSRRGARRAEPDWSGEFASIEAVLPAARMPAPQRQLPGLTGARECSSPASAGAHRCAASRRPGHGRRRTRSTGRST